MDDILLMPFGVGTPKGSVGLADTIPSTWVGVPRTMLALGPRRGPLQDLSINSLAGRFMREKRGFGAQNHDFPWKFWDFLENSLISLEMPWKF